MDIWLATLERLIPALQPHLPWLVPLVILLVVASFPMVGRGPGSSRRDPWRTYRFGPRATVMERAGRRCEGAAFVAWGRCDAPATEVDHVFPWSKGGPTVESNGQALCRGHNRSKGAMTPPWWYVLGLERRRRDYFPAGADVRVFATMRAEDRAAREATRGYQRGRIRS
jgi:hypothetical protein